MREESAVGCWVSQRRSFMSTGTKENTMTSCRRGLVFPCLAAGEPGIEAVPEAVHV